MVFFLDVTDMFMALETKAHLFCSKKQFGKGHNTVKKAEEDVPEY